MITNNYCAFHASKGPRWGPRASIQKEGMVEGKEQGTEREMGRNGKTDEEKVRRDSVSP